MAQGLKILKAGRGPAGIAALAAAARREIATLTAEDLAFAVAPRLNAAGRLEDMIIGIQALLTDDTDTARVIAERLDGINRERRTIETTMREQAESLVERDWPADLPAGRSLRCRCRRPSEKVRPLGAWPPYSRLYRRCRHALPRPCVALWGTRAGRGSQCHARPDCLLDFTQAMEAAVAQRVTSDLFCDVIATDGELAAHECTLETARALEAGEAPEGKGSRHRCS